jgi:hypothetical protein
MLPELNYNQNVFIEITNLNHGGQGWELGICLWSPVFDKGGAEAWKIMSKINQGDIIIHLVSINNEYHWYGVSVVNSGLIQTSNSPPSASNWSNMLPYQRINLKNHNKINFPIAISVFFDKYEQQLKKILADFNHGQFYVNYGTDEQLRVSQRYIAKCPGPLYLLFTQFSNTFNFHPIFGLNENFPTLNEPQNPDYNPPNRILTTISRIIRDTELSKLIKIENNWRCQICGKNILLPTKNYYAEGHHLMPLGGEHKGLDIRPNIIVLCPTHHTEFDYGCIAINSTNNLIEHIDTCNPFHNKEIAYYRKDLGTEHLLYHYQKRFNQI